MDCLQKLYIIGDSRSLYRYFRLFYTVSISKKLLMAGFKPRHFDVGSDNSASCATTITQNIYKKLLKSKEL